MEASQGGDGEMIGVYLEEAGVGKDQRTAVIWYTFSRQRCAPHFLGAVYISPACTDPIIPLFICLEDCLTAVGV